MASTVKSQSTPTAGIVNPDEYVAYQLLQTQSRIKLTEMLTVSARLGIFVCGYVLAFVVLDQWLIPGGFGAVARWLALSVLGGITFSVLVRGVVVPYFRQVHALYAARMIERSDPGLKSSLLNLVDLRTHGLEASQGIQAAMEKRAAVQLTKIDLEQAIDRKSLLRVAYVLLGLVFISCLYVLLSPKDALASVRRLLLPTSSTAVATQTTIANVSPEDTQVMAGEQLTIEADLVGKIPEQVLLQFTTADREFVDQPVEMQRMEPEIPRYRAILAGDKGRGLTQNLTYRIVAHDARTRDYRVRVVQPPTSNVDGVHYVFPSYMQLEPRHHQGGHIEGWEGAQVTVAATTNLPVQSAVLVLTDSEDPQARGEEIRMRITEGTKLSADWKLGFRKDGTYARYYHIECRTAAGERDPRPTVYTLKVHPDQRPEVQLVFPTQDLERPLNAVVPLSVKAADPDFRLRFVTLRLAKDGEEIHTAMLLDEEQPEFAGTLDLALQQLPGLKAGDEIQYWVEARDNKQPLGNRSSSPRMKIKITEPVAKQQAEQQAAQDRQAQAEQEAAQPQNPNQPGDPQQPAEGENQTQPNDQQQPPDAQNPGRTKPQPQPPKPGDQQQPQQPRPGQDDQPGEEGMGTGEQNGTTGETPPRGQPQPKPGQQRPRNTPPMNDKNQQREPAEAGSDSETGSGTESGTETSPEKNGTSPQRPPNGTGRQPNRAQTPGTKPEQQPTMQKMPPEEQTGEQQPAGSDPSNGEQTGSEAPPETQSGQNRSGNKQPGKNAEQNKADEQTALQRLIRQFGGSPEQNKPKDNSADKPEQNTGTDAEKPPQQSQNANGATPEQRPGANSKPGPMDRQPMPGTNADTQNPPMPGDMTSEGTADKPASEQGTSPKPGSGTQPDKRMPPQNTTGGAKPPQTPADMPPENGTDPAPSEAANNGMDPTENPQPGAKGTRPGEKPAQKTNPTGANQPGTKPENKPGTKPENQPGKNSPMPMTPGDAETEGQDTGDQPGDKPGTKPTPPMNARNNGVAERASDPQPKSRPPRDMGNSPQPMTGAKPMPEGQGGTPSDANPGTPPEQQQPTDKPGRMSAKPQPGKNNQPTPQVGEKPGEKPGTKSNDPTPGASSKEPGREETEPGMAPQRPDGSGRTDDGMPTDERPQQPKTTTPREKRPGEGTSEPQPRPGEGRPNQKSPQSDAGEQGGGTPQETGTSGSKQTGAGDKTQRPGTQQNSPKPTGKPGDKPGPGSPKRPGQTGSKPMNSDTEQPAEGAEGTEGTQPPMNETGATGTPQPGTKPNQQPGRQPGKSGQKPENSESSSEPGTEPGPEPGMNSAAPMPDAADQPGQKNGAGQKPGAGQQPGAGQKPGDQPGKSAPPGTGAPKPGAKGTGQPGQRGGAGQPGGQGGMGENDGPTAPAAEVDPAETADEANLEYAKQASNLVLQKLKKDQARGEVDPKLLEELGWTKEDLARFTKRLEEQLQQTPSEEDSPAATAQRLQFEEMLKTIGLSGKTQKRTYDPSKTSRVGEVGARNIPVPREYRELYEAYTRSLSSGDAKAKQPAPPTPPAAPKK